MYFRDVNRTDNALDETTKTTFLKNMFKNDPLSVLVNIATLLNSPAFSEQLIFDDDETVPGI